MTPLESRKQLLIVESELNRVQLAADAAALKADVRTVLGRAKSFSTIASSAAMLLSALSAFRRRPSAQAAEGGAKRSWLQILLRGAGLLSSIWLALRAPRDPDGH